jgi:hypothetical protein
VSRRNILGVSADGDDTNAARIEVRKALLETP